MGKREAPLALIITVIWGVQFVITDAALKTVPPLLFATLRFALVAIPAVFFVRRPAVSWRVIAAVGLTSSAGQFALQYLSLQAGMPPGLLSLVVQVQAIFTVILAAVFLRERPSWGQVLGVLIGMAGIAVISAGYGAQAPPLPLILAIAGAFCWAAGNTITRSARVESGFSLVAWSALAAPLPLLVTSLAAEGPATDWRALSGLSAGPVLGLLFVAYLSSIVGYGLWSRLLARYQAASVAPYSLLVPVVGIATAWLALGERPRPTEYVGAVIMLAGVLLATTRRPAVAVDSAQA